jgi:DNA-directed RNA polymerase specialized sigma24 family protein
MTPFTMSVLTRRSFEEVVDGDGPRTLAEAQALEPALSGLTLAELVGLARAEVPLSRQDEVFGAVVRSYRRGPTKVWGAILLEMLAPALGGAANEVVAWEPVSDADDLYQQAALEALSAAAQMPLWGDGWLKRRIVFRVRIALLRWSAAQYPQASLDTPVRPDDPDDPDDAEDAGDADLISLISLFELLDTMGCVLSRQEFDLVYRTTVLKEEMVELAREMGSTFDAVRMKRDRALIRLRPHAA